MAFPKMIKPGLALVLFGSSGFAINDQTGVLSDTIYNLIFVFVYLDLVLFYLLLDVVRAIHPELFIANSIGFHRRIDFYTGIYHIIASSFTNKSP